MDKAAAAADVTSVTAKIFELDEDAVIDARKREALRRVYAGFAQAGGREASK